VVFVGQMLIGRYPPLLENNELIPIIVGELNEEVCEVHVFKEPLFGMLVVSVAWVTDKGLVLIVERFGASRPLTAIARRASIAGCFFSIMVCTLRVSADVHVALDVLKVLSIEPLIDLGIQRRVAPLALSCCVQSWPVSDSKDVIEIFFSKEFLEATQNRAPLGDMRLLREFFDVALEGPPDFPLCQVPAKALMRLPSHGSIEMRLWNVTHLSNDLPVPWPLP
jgi:hypothetical protein